METCSLALPEGWWQLGEPCMPQNGLALQNLGLFFPRNPPAWGNQGSKALTMTEEQLFQLLLPREMGGDMGSTRHSLDWAAKRMA